jgi:hypothetical protein
LWLSPEDLKKGDRTRKEMELALKEEDEVSQML